VRAGAGFGRVVPSAAEARMRQRIGQEQAITPATMLPSTSRRDRDFRCGASRSQLPAQAQAPGQLSARGDSIHRTRAPVLDRLGSSRPCR
jgi:hypothetical protein